VWQTWASAIVVAALLGIGLGVFMSVDFALMTDVLPRATDRGKDLGVINIANALPQVAAPALAAPIVTHLGGYRVLYGVAAVVGLAGAILVGRIGNVDQISPGARDCVDLRLRRVGATSHSGPADDSRPGLTAPPPPEPHKQTDKPADTPAPYESSPWT
jgi:MFS family permease